MTGFRFALARIPLSLCARLGFSIPSAFSGPRGITPVFGYDAPHPSVRRTLTFQSNTLLSTHYGPLRIPLAFHRFPGDSGYTASCSADFSTGRGGSLQLLSMSLPSCCRYNPARMKTVASVRLQRSMLPSPFQRELDFWGCVFEAISAFTFVTARWLAHHP
jgi:hypothetical protein